MHMTCIERFWKEHPDLAPKGKCPHEYGYLPERPWDCCEQPCWKCWMQEAVEATDIKKGES